MKGELSREQQSTDHDKCSIALRELSRLRCTNAGCARIPVRKFDLQRGEPYKSGQTTWLAPLWGNAPDHAPMCAATSTRLLFQVLSCVTDLFLLYVRSTSPRCRSCAAAELRCVLEEIFRQIGATSSATHDLDRKIGALTRCCHAFRKRLHCRRYWNPKQRQAAKDNQSLRSLQQETSQM